MLDTHCHLEQQDYNKDRERVILDCKKELKAVITCCAHPKDFDLTMNMVEKYENFIFATAGIHPEYIKEISKKEKDSFLELIRENKDKIQGIGETGLDYFWVKESKWQEKQKELFQEMISFAKELKKPLIIHSRDAHEDCVKILEQEDAKQVQMHMFGANQLLQRVIDNGWLVSLNTIVLKSKKHRKVARDVPLERLLTETDAPWLGPEGKRNTPLSVKAVIEKIAEIKKIGFEEVDGATTENAVRFFNLPIKT